MSHFDLKILPERQSNWVENVLFENRFNRKYHVKNFNPNRLTSNI